MNQLKVLAAMLMTFLSMAVPLWLLLEYPSVWAAFMVLFLMVVAATAGAMSAVYYQDQARKDRETTNYWRNRCRVCYTIVTELRDGECLNCCH